MINYKDFLNNSKILPSEILLLDSSSANIEMHLKELVKTIICSDKSLGFCNTCPTCKNVDNELYNYQKYDLKKSQLSKKDFEDIKRKLSFDYAEKKEAFFTIIFSVDLLNQNILQLLFSEINAYKKNCYFIFVTNNFSNTNVLIKNRFLIIKLHDGKIETEKSDKNTLKKFLNFQKIEENTEIAAKIKTFDEILDSFIKNNNRSNEIVEFFKDCDYKEISILLSYLENLNSKKKSMIVELKNSLNLSPIKSIIALKIIRMFGDEN